MKLTEHPRWKDFEKGIVPDCKFTPLEILKDDAGATIFVLRFEYQDGTVYFQVVAVVDADTVYPLLSMAKADPSDVNFGLPIDEDDETFYKAKCLEWSKKDA